jgi:hypothetical protein
MADRRDVPVATVACPDLTTFTRLDELGRDVIGNDSSQIALFLHAESSIPTCTTLRTPCGTAQSGTPSTGTPLNGKTLRDIVTLSDRRTEDQRSA